MESNKKHTKSPLFAGGFVALFLPLAFSCSEKGNDDRDGPFSEEISNHLSDDNNHKSQTDNKEDMEFGVNSIQDLEMANKSIGRIFTWDDFLDLYEIIQSLEVSESQEHLFLSNALANASRRGLAFESIHFLERNMGPGGKREQIIHRIFSNTSGEPPLATLVDMARNLDHQSEMSIALRAISSSIARNSVANIMDYFNSIHEDREMIHTVGIGVSEKLVHHQFLDPKEIVDLTKLIRTNNTNHDFINGLLHYSTEFMLDTLWPEFLEHGAKWEGNRDLFIKQAAGSFPRESFQKIVEWQHASPDDINTVVQTWLRADPRSATQEIGGNPHLSGNQLLYNQAALNIVEYAVSHGEAETASQWADRISDPLVKDRAIHIMALQQNSWVNFGSGSFPSV